MVFLLFFAKLIDRHGKLLLKKFNRTQHPRIQKIHLCINVECIILEGRSAQTQSIGGFQQSGSTGNFTGRIFNGLTFIQYHIIERNFNQLTNIAS